MFTLENVSLCIFFYTFYTLKIADFVSTSQIAQLLINLGVRSSIQDDASFNQAKGYRGSNVLSDKRDFLERNSMAIKDK